MNQFKIFAPTMIASRGADGKLRIEGVASSTVRDHHGDQITKRGLEKMAQSAVGLTIFLNHEYRVPEDVFGTVEKVRLERTGIVDQKSGEEIYDLRMGIVVQKANPRAVSAFEQMEAGPDKVPTKLGLSIGAMVPDGGAVFDKSAGGRYIVDDLDLVETSLVSMPANPRSWVDSFVKSITKSLAEANEAIGLPVMITKQRSALAEVMEAEGVRIVDTIDEDDLTPDKPDEVNVIEAPTNDDALEMDNDGEPGDRPDDAGDAGGGEEAPAEEAPDAPDAGDAPAEDAPEVPHEPVEKTRVTVWDGDKTVEIDTGRSKPKTEDHSAQAMDGSGDAGGPSEATTKALQLGDGSDPEPDILKATLGQLAAARAENVQLRDERDAAIKAADLALDGTQAIIQHLLDSPMGRKAVVVEAETKLTTLRADLYDPEVQHLMLKQKG